MNQYLKQILGNIGGVISELRFTYRKIRYYLLLLYVTSMPIVIYLENSEYGYTKVIYTFVYISALMIFWMAEIVFKNKELSVKFTKLTWPVTGIIIAGLLSGINASSFGVIFQSLAVVIYFYLVYLLIVNTVQTSQEAHNLLSALVIAGAAAALYGFLQYLGLVLGPFGKVPGNDSIISTFGNRNYLGGFLAYLFVPTLGLALVARNKAFNYLAALTLGLFFVILLPINSIGSWLGLVAGLLFFVGGMAFYRPVDIVKNKKFLLIFLILILFIAYLFSSAPGALNSLPGYSQGEDAQGKVVASSFINSIYKMLIEEGGPRIQDWRIALKMVEDHPFFGVGLGNFKIKFLEYRREFLKTDPGRAFQDYIPRGARAHNEYLQLAAELGLIGSLLVLGALFFMTVYLLKVIQGARAQKERIFFLALLSGVVSYLVHSGFSFPAHLPASSLGFVTFIGLMGSNSFAEKNFEFKASGSSKYITVGILTIFLLATSILAVRDWRANILRKDGRALLEAGHYRLARRKFNRSMALDFYPRQTYYFLGLTEMELGNLKRAEGFFKKSLGRFEPYQLLLRLGKLNLQQGDLSRAEKYFKELLATSPKQSTELKANYYLAKIYLRKKEYENSERVLAKILKEKPNFSHALYLRGALAYARRNNGIARRNWKKALRIIQERLNEIEEKLTGSLTLKKRKSLQNEKKTLEVRMKKLKENINSIGSAE